MSYKTGAKGNNREFGLHGGPGKGSKTRVKNTAAYGANFDQIKFTGVQLFRRGNKKIKTYS